MKNITFYGLLSFGLLCSSLSYGTDCTVGYAWAAGGDGVTYTCTDNFGVQNQCVYSGAGGGYGNRDYLTLTFPASPLLKQAVNGINTKEITSSQIYSECATYYTNYVWVPRCVNPLYWAPFGYWNAGPSGFICRAKQVDFICQSQNGGVSLSWGQNVQPMSELPSPQACANKFSSILQNGD